MSKKKSKTSRAKIVPTQTLSKDFKKYLLIGLTLINSSIWILSYFQIGYDLVRSLGGDSKFSDFTMAIYYAPIFFDPRLLNSEPPFDYGMTPPLAVFFGAINPNYWTETLLILNLMALATIYYCISKILKLDNFVILIFVNSFPIVFCILRGSADLWLLALLLVSFYSLMCGHPISSALLLGFLVACKPHFAAFGLMYLVNRDWKSIGVLGSSSITFFVSPLLWLNNFGIIDQLRVFLQISRNYQKTYAVGDGGLMWDNGFISFIKVIYYTIAQPSNEKALDFGEAAVRVQVFIVLILLVPVMLKYLRQIPSTMEVWLMSSILFVLMSPVSASYRLVVFVPAFIFFFYKSNSKFLVLSLGILLLPKSFLWVKTSNGHEFVGESLLNPLILFCMYIYLLLDKQKSNEGSIRNFN